MLFIIVMHACLFILQPARLKSQRELRFESAVPVAIFDSRVALYFD